MTGNEVRLKCIEFATELAKQCPSMTSVDVMEIAKKYYNYIMDWNQPNTGGYTISIKNGTYGTT